ncbi:MAG: UDP-N-acetylmuramate--L-alanine ligase [Flavobacteriales bacterium]|nr:UDP-N-acetylmuramate--L-alanine ligase [Flavobacteriales bacterium]
MKLKEYKNIYFVGIGGIGMSSIARYFNNKNVNIFGYDRVKSSLCIELENEGMKIHYTEDTNQISVQKEDTLVIYTPAIPSENTELSYFVKNNYIVMKRSEVLGKITEDHFTIAIAGTHGKTTTSTMIAHILHDSGMDCTAFLGGVSTNYNSNLIFGTEKSVVVVEADEFDRSFLTLNPDVAVITSVDADHLDIYQNKERLISAFSDFTNKIKSGGTLFLEENIDTSIVNRDDISVLKYGLSISSDCKGTYISPDKNTMKFQVECNGNTFDDLRLNMGGVYNVLNAVASVSVANLLEIDSSKIVDGINTFMGIRRRFETHISSDNLVFIDDYAHHPKEVKESINAVKQMYPEREITVVFQPHLHSRTKDFMNEFANSLSLADELILLDIYGAREEEIEGVSSQILLNKCTSTKKELSALDSIVEKIADKEIDVLLTLGAGDISTIIEPLRLRLS